jgi:rhodanese-related sulfurtransferase
MKHLFLILILIISSISFAQNKSQTYHEMLKTYYKNTVVTIQPIQLYKRILKGEKIYILDTREEKEFSVSRIQGAIHVGYDKFDITSTYDYKKDAIIIVYCTIGARSETIGEKLLKNGFTSVFNLYGGLIYWKNQDYPLIDSKGIETQNIHVYSEEWGKWLKKGKAIH